MVGKMLIGLCRTIKLHMRAILALTLGAWGPTPLRL